MIIIFFTIIILIILRYVTSRCVRVPVQIRVNAALNSTTTPTTSTATVHSHASKFRCVSMCSTILLGRPTIAGRSYIYRCLFDIQTPIFQTAARRTAKNT